MDVAKSSVCDSEFNSATRSLLKLAKTHHYKVDRCLKRGEFESTFTGVRLRDNLPVLLKVMKATEIPNWGLLEEQLYPQEIIMLSRAVAVPGTVRTLDMFNSHHHIVVVFPHHPKRLNLNQLSNAAANTPTARLKALCCSSGSRSGLSENKLRFVARQLVSILVSLRQAGVLHRDVKADNLLVDPKTGELTLQDFSQATEFHEGDYKRFRGTLNYMPPEYILHRRHTADGQITWSLGILLFSLLTLNSTETIISLICGLKRESAAAVLQNRISAVLQRLAGGVSQEGQDLLRRCLCVDETARMKLSEVMEHPWLAEGSYCWKQ